MSGLGRRSEEANPRTVSPIRLAVALAEFPSLELGPVETNIVYLRYLQGSGAELSERLRERGVLVSVAGPDRVRACTHMGITDRGLERALKVFSQVLSR